MMRTPLEALRWIRRHGIATMTPTPRFQSLVAEVAGGPVRGSWWGHPKGKVMFRLAESLHDSPESTSAKLVDGKVTFLHRALWPALARVVTDVDWRKSAGYRLSPEAGRLLRVVEKRGTLRLDGAGLKCRKELESTLFVYSGSVHTEKGSHATVLTSWRKVFDSETLALARKLSLPEARALLGME